MAYDFGEELMREVTDLLTNTNTYGGFTGDELASYKELRAAIPWASLETLCPELQEGAVPILSESDGQAFAPDALGFGGAVGEFFFADYGTAAREVYEELRSDDRDYWFELALVQCQDIDAGATVDSAIAALAEPFLDEGVNRDMAMEVGKTMWWDAAYEACPRHYGLTFGR
jgi:hypothetical protein